jgi:hypothetical protein
MMEENAGALTSEYWPAFAASVSGKDAIITWNGNQHYTNFMFETDRPFDFFDPDTGYLPDMGEAILLPRTLIKEYFDCTIAPLRTFLSQLAEAHASSVTVVGTPPPWPDLACREAVIKIAPFWKPVALRCGVDIATARLMPAPILLKLWRVIQEMVEEAAIAVNVRFVGVPRAALTESGYLREDCRLPIDFTHANDKFGRMMMRLALGLELEE